VAPEDGEKLQEMAHRLSAEMEKDRRRGGYPSTGGDGSTSPPMVSETAQSRHRKSADVGRSEIENLEVRQLMDGLPSEIRFDGRISVSDSC